MEFVHSSVEQVVTKNNSVSGLQLLNGTLVSGDLYVVAAGYSSNYMLRNIGIRIPLMAIKVSIILLNMQF